MEMRDPHINLNLNLDLMECIQDMYNLIILSSIKWFKTNSAQPFLSDGFCLNCKRCWCIKQIWDTLLSKKRSVQAAVLLSL